MYTATDEPTMVLHLHSIYISQAPQVTYQVFHINTCVQGWPRDKPFVFDVVSASALCERPDYEATSVVVGLAAAQVRGREVWGS